MLHTSRHGLILTLFVSSAVLSACGGGGNPSGPSGSPAQGVTMIGMVLGAGAGSPAGVSSASAAGDVTVTVQENPAITTKVGSDGSFTLRGLPEGGFTLVFTDASGAVLGTLVFSEVRPNQEITVTVDVTGGTVRLVDERRNGIGHGGIEIEGRVDAVVTATEAGDSTFVIAGYTVIARPGVTAIREGNRRRTVEDVTGGRRVHVKGEWLPPVAGSQPVLAHEIKLQGSDDGDDDEGGNGSEKVTICHKLKNTISVSVSAWPAHQAHGDTMGACK